MTSEQRTQPTEVKRPTTAPQLVAAVIALLFAVAFAAPTMLVEFGPNVGIGLPRDVKQGLSDFVFDFGFWICVAALLAAIVGLTRRGWSRRLACLAIVLVLMPLALMWL